MKQIDTKQWKEFVIKDLFVTEKKGVFKVPTGAYVDKKQLKEGAIPRITVTGINNGVYGYYDCDSKNKDYRIYENIISVSFLGTVFYHKGKVSLDMKVHCLKPLHIELNEYIGLFLVTAINKSLKNSSYSDQISSTVLANLSINLPIDETGDPDFLYMESYMKNLELSVSSSLTDLQSAKKSGVLGKLELSNWKPFRIIDLFTVKNTHSILKSEIIEDSGTIPYVTASNENNGVYSYIDYYDHLKEEGNCIMIGGKTLTITYQKGDFFSNDSHNLALYLKDNIHRTEKIHLFLVTVLRKSIGHSYSWGNSISFKSIQEDYVNLPVDGAGNPDYSYMESYISNKFRKTEKALNELVACV